MKKIKFIDLYAGLGGFHQALEKLGHDCVWASEYNLNLRELYKKNFPKTPIEGDIFQVDLTDIPSHDLICGGFPCQPFSRAGKMLGFGDLQKGNHFFKILEIIDSKKNDAPKYLLLENVETILKHDNGRTFEFIQSELINRGYEIEKKILSPHEFNIPHHRRRLFIVGARKDMGGLENFNFPEKRDLSKTTINSILCLDHIPHPEENLSLSIENNEVLNLWSNFIETFPDDISLPGFPIWSHEWGATYPFENYTPQSSTIEELNKLRGTYGKNISGTDKEIIINKFIPRYAQKDLEKFPNWKIVFIKKNREFYKKNKDFIDLFVLKNPKLKDFEFSYQKLEWSCSGAPRTFDDKIIQFRPSGLRVKLNNWSPALTTIRTQNIYIPKIKRKLSLLELSKLQSMKIKHLPDIYDGKFVPNGGYKAFGNAVNVEVVRLIAKNLLNI
jgi:DNA (cytosine-5)-methyltransferase 1